jgi:hypothetical protein
VPDRFTKNDLASDADSRGDSDSLTTSSEPPKFSSREAFDEVLRAHRERRPAEEVHFLEHLCFPLDETADPSGMRFVLWQPVALFLQHGFQVEIEDQMCNGQVVLAYLRHDAAVFTNKVIARIDADRHRYPQAAVSIGLQILIQTLPDIAKSLQWIDQPTFEKVDRMLRKFKSAVHQGEYPGLPALRAQLSELAAVSKESDVRACVEFLRAGGEDARSWPPHSAAVASERALARDWLTPEEDAAWSYLQKVM